MYKRIIVILVFGLVGGCQMTRVTDEGGISETIIGFHRIIHSTPSATTLSYGLKTTSSTIPIHRDFCKSRADVAAAKVRINESYQYFRGAGNYQGDSSVKSVDSLIFKDKGN